MIYYETEYRWVFGPSQGNTTPAVKGIRAGRARPGEGDWTQTTLQRGKVGLIRLRFSWQHLGADRCETLLNLAQAVLFLFLLAQSS